MHSNVSDYCHNGLSQGNAMPETQLVDSDKLEQLVLERAPNIDLEWLMDTTMDELASVATKVLGAPVTFDEEGGPGGIISNVFIHWDK
jgi:hypothetical protein